MSMHIHNNNSSASYQLNLVTMAQPRMRSRVENSITRSGETTTMRQVELLQLILACFYLIYQGFLLH